MKYQGSKRRIAREIYQIMRSYHKKRTWVEPFVGGGNMISFVKGKRIGHDLNIHTINALKMIRDNLDKIPKNNTEFTKDDYLALKEKYKNGETSELIGFAGFNYSFGAKLWDSWRADKEGIYDYVKGAFNTAKKQSPKLQNIKLICESYDKIEMPPNSLIYCDPPYQGTAEYKNKEDFNHDDFWQWCRDKQKEGHIVFISEYNAPSDFKSIWSKELTTTLSKDDYKTNTEHLFVHNSFKVKIGMFDMEEL